MIEHIISHFLSSKVDRRLNQWVDAGRIRMPIVDGDQFVLRFGWRYRVRAIGCTIVLSAITLLALWCHFFSESLGFWLGVVYAGLIFPMSLASVYCAWQSLTYRITVSSVGFSVQRVFFADTDVAWDSIKSIRWRRLGSTLVVDTETGKRVRVSTDLDGMIAFADLMSKTSRTARDHSFVHWMLEKL